MSDDVKTRLAAARAAKEAKDKAASAAADERELAVFELEERLEKELGARGSYFEIVDTIDGPIAVKLGEAVLHTRFQSAKDITDVVLHEYVFPCIVHPTKEEYLAAVSRRPGVALRCASALATLYGVKAADTAGKF